MAIRVAKAWFAQPACIANKNETAINAERDKRLSLELVPQGLLVRVVGFARPFLVGNTNIRSCELYEDVASPQPVPATPAPAAPETKKPAGKRGA